MTKAAPPPALPDTEAVLPNWSSGGIGTWYRKQRKEVEAS